jgi:hypothetical protein
VDLETNLDPGKLLDFHDVMLSSVQDDERVRQLWEASQAADTRRRREGLRQEWLSFHERMRVLHEGLAAEHGARAEALLEEAG